MSDVSYYTPEGFKKLKAELEHLENVERPRVTQDIADARDKGDLSENAEIIMHLKRSNRTWNSRLQS